MIARADGAREAEREVDLAEQQDEDLGHAEHDERAACSSRLTRLPAERKTDVSIWKMMTMTIRPATTGSTPLSPRANALHPGAERTR